MIYLSGKVRPDIPAMLTPNTRNRLAPGQVWAADNGRYTRPDTYTEERYIKWLARMPVESCLFATAPDVVGDARATIDLSRPMFETIRQLGYRVALVAQDGLEDLDIPWDEIDVLFIGGSPTWRFEDGCRRLAREAKRQGKWLHMGRVNSLRRMRYAASIGCDSADGTVLKHDPSRRVETWGALVASEASLWRPQ